MALLTRVSRLFKADFHAVLDHIEEPEQLLRQAIREMEDELQGSEVEIARCEQEQESLDDHSRELASRIDGLNAELDLCFEAEKDELARSLVRRKLLAERTVRHLESRQQANLRFLKKERQQLDENRTTLEGLRQKADVFLAKTPAAAQGADFALQDTHGEMSVSDDEIEIAFLREKSARSSS